MCVFITAVPSVKLFAWGEGDSGGHVLARDDEPRPVWTSLHARCLRCVFTGLNYVCVYYCSTYYKACVFITVVPITSEKNM